MANSDELLKVLQNGEKAYVDEVYSKCFNDQVQNITCPQIKGYLADKSEQLRQAVYDNYREFLAITRRLEEIEQDFMTIHTQFNAIGTELDELNQHYATEMKEQQQKLDKLVKERSAFLNITAGESSDKNDISSRVPQLRKDIETILDAPALLQVYLSQWNFDECIKIHDQVKKLLADNTCLKNVLKGHIALIQFEEMIDHIVEKLQKRLFDLSLSTRQTVVIINHLKKVTNEEKAMRIFLDARSEVTKERVSREMGGESVVSATQDVCLFAFGLIKSTNTIFTTAFTTAPLSCFSSWNISMTNFVLSSVEKRVCNKEVKQNAVKIECVDKILTLYNKNIPEKLSLIFIVKKYLTNIVRSLSKSKDDVDPKIIKKLAENGFVFTF
ncbi:hypothetical protein EIN_026240 [Entamoeba invadens IP1]|uniref:hypothetical protein n=1 Tax=Entamoeba invadens IP1 TaxID=370355 RepID=UPI0002C3D30E|nr:hypothetical protein EIN_026240 [Entamoeba invadens IP1]ELP90775.1 hypothetical protein EIN_026240 [Entamoeba invadens IP1]|eukprot:XP_004257546.1 hypothetical protein EIN_026240 [Entamoeba invadens IP1]